jgi:membrane protein implicated in regulation of membrane protease activity
MPYGSWVNDLPTGFFLAVHIAAFALGAGFAWLAFKRELALLGVAFSLFAAAELVYMTYHLDWTVFLFAHTIAEVLDLGAFVLVFAGAVYSVVRRPALGVTHS